MRKYHQQHLGELEKEKPVKEHLPTELSKWGVKTTAVFSLNSWNCSSWELLFSASGVLLSFVEKKKKRDED